MLVHRALGDDDDDGAGQSSSHGGDGWDDVIFPKAFLLSV